MPRATPSSIRHAVPTPDRRAVLRAAAWGVPAIAVASAAPAYAVSVAEGCLSSAALVGATWRVVEGALSNPTNPNTGWSNATSALPHFTGGRVAAGTFAAQPAGAFISFADNASTTSRATVEIAYEFEVTGDVTFQLASPVTFGYGVADRPGYDERQSVVAAVIDGATTTEVAKFALERVAAGDVQRPTGSSESRLARSEAEMAGYRLFPAGDTGRVSHTVHSSPVRLVGSDTEARRVTVTYTLTLDRRGQAQVNDDVIIQMPTLLTCA